MAGQCTPEVIEYNFAVWRHPAHIAEGNRGSCRGEPHAGLIDRRHRTARGKEFPGVSIKVQPAGRAHHEAKIIRRSKNDAPAVSSSADGSSAITTEPAEATAIATAASIIHRTDSTANGQANKHLLGQAAHSKAIIPLCVLILVLILVVFAELGGLASARILKGDRLLPMGDDGHPIWLRRFLDQGTTWQKLLLAFGAMAGALLAIGGLAVAINKIGDGGDGPARSQPATTSNLGGALDFRRTDPLKSETADANKLVALFTVAARAYAAEPDAPDSRVTLDFYVDAEPQDSGRIKLNYGCPNEPPCEAALQAWEPTMFDVNQGATLFKGVYIVRIQRGQPDRNIEFGLRRVEPS